MLHQLLNFLPLAQVDEHVDTALTLHPPAPSWMPAAGWYALIILGGALAVGLSVYLYSAQRRVASRRVVMTLTAIRTLLVALMFFMLVGPGCQFTHTGASNGTLWLMLDQSSSMNQPDAQATKLERFRWADALGYLPQDHRPSDLGHQAAQLTALRGDLTHLQALATPSDEAQAPTRLADLIKNLRRWNQQLTAVIEAVEKDPQGKSDAETIAALRGVLTSVGQGIQKAESRTKPEQVAADIPWLDASTALDPAAASLAALADKSDTDLIAKNDSRVNEAMDKAGKLNRAKLAELVLTDPSKKSRTANAFGELMPKQNVKVLAFGDQPQIVASDKEDAPARKVITSVFEKTNAPATDIASGLKLIAEQVVQNEPASVVIVGDGRQNKSNGELGEAARRLASRGVRVFSLAVGSREVVPDAAVENVDAPDWVFKGDTLKLDALLRLDGLAGKTVTAELHRGQRIDGQTTDTLIDSQEITVPTPPPGAANQIHKVVTFAERKDQLPDAGLYDYRVEIKPVPDEAVKENNTQTVRVSVKDHKLAMLMIEDQPRWEYRYVANYLGRDKRVKLQTVLLQSARIEKVTPPTPVKASPDNEKTDAQILPQTQDEWYKFDCIVLGDLAPETLSKQQQQYIVKAVTERGATLILMAGPLNMPGNWGTSKSEYPLTELFPVEPNPEWTPQALQNHLRNGFHPQIAPDGQNSLLTQFGVDDQANAKDWSLIATDPDLSWYWHSDMTQAKGGAQVIWSIADNDANARRSDAKSPTANQSAADPLALETANKRALLATMNVGLGKVMYFAGDGTWRLRQVNGQNLHERFWGQVVRWVVGNDLPAGGQFVRFGTDKPRYVNGESATVTARVFDKHMAPLKGQKVKVIARAVAPGAAADPKAARVEAEMTETPESPGQYRATLRNLPSGPVEISLVGGEVPQLLADDPTALQKTLTIDVEKGLNLEQKNVNTDRNTLSFVASAGTGAMLDAPYADVLADHVPELNYKVTSAEQIGLFGDPKDRWTKYTHWIFLGTFILLITSEWIIRKAGGLV